MSKKTSLRQAIDEFCEESWGDEEILLFGGIGFQQFKGPVAVYDREKCIEALAQEFAAEDGNVDAYQDAVEYFEFNTEGSWVGEKTPIIISSFV